MVKAVFIDYMGTTVEEHSPEMAEIVERIISDAEEQIGLADDCSVLVRLIRSHWVNAPVFPDVPGFFAQCPVPI